MLALEDMEGSHRPRVRNDRSFDSSVEGDAIDNIELPLSDQAFLTHISEL